MRDDLREARQRPSSSSLPSTYVSSSIGFSVRWLPGPSHSRRHLPQWLVERRTPLAAPSGSAMHPVTSLRGGTIRSRRLAIGWPMRQCSSFGHLLLLGSARVTGVAGCSSTPHALAPAVGVR